MSLIINSSKHKNNNNNVKLKHNIYEYLYKNLKFLYFFNLIIFLTIILYLINFIYINVIQVKKLNFLHR